MMVEWTQGSMGAREKGSMGAREGGTVDEQARPGLKDPGSFTDKGAREQGCRGAGERGNFEGNGQRGSGAGLQGAEASRAQEEMKKEEVRRSGRFVINPPVVVVPPPVGLLERERLLEYQKPRPFAYTPLLFGTLFGMVLFVLFLLSGSVAGVLLGAAVWAGLFWFLFTRYYRRAGCWFTDARLIIDDGSRIQLVPYEEVALSSIMLEEDGLLFSTVYGKEIILRGMGDPARTADFLARKARELRAAGGAAPRPPTS